MKILLKIAYDGTNYNGWQFQENVNTVQKEIEEALSKINKSKIKVMGASRTDKGVHALGQQATYNCDNKIPMEKLPYAINTVLPDDIRIFSAKEVDYDFHPIIDAKNKTYRYKIENSPIKNPIIRNQCWHIYKDLDIEKMSVASKHIIGEYDFSCFCASGSTVKTKVRKVNWIEIKKREKEIYIDINGNGFLYNMVRIIAGTLAYVGYGKIKADDIPNIILSKDRTKAGVTAPPEGLTLMEVNY